MDVSELLKQAKSSCFRCAQDQVPHFARTETSKKPKWLHDLGTVVELDGKKLNVITCLAPHVWDRTIQEAP